MSKPPASATHSVHRPEDSFAEEATRPLSERLERLALGDPSNSVHSAHRRPHQLGHVGSDGQVQPDHAEDARFYGLLATLFFGVAPYRVATLYVRAPDSQHEDVTEETLAQTSTGNRVDPVLSELNNRARWWRPWESPVRRAES